MNNYSIEFFSNCPTNGVRVKYALSIEVPSKLVIQAEQLVAEVEAVESGPPVFHEEIADRFAAKFPGSHTLKAHHHGVDIETTRQGI